MLVLVALSVLGATAIGQCQTSDAPLLGDLRWQAAVIAPRTGASAGAPTRQIGLPRITTAPVIDGRLDDGVWSEAARTDAWMDLSGDATAAVQTQAWVARGAERLFFAFRCEEPDLPGLVAQVTEDGGPVWNDDCIELFFDGNLDRETYRQIAINSLGKVTALDRGNREWSPRIERAAQVGRDEWTVELVVYISDLGILGSEFGLNLCRERRAGGRTELSAWSPTGRSFGIPASFGLAKLGASYLKSFDPGAAAVGLNQVRVVMLNDSDEPRRLRARLEYWQDDEIAREAYSFYHELEPGAEREVSMPYAISNADEPVKLELTVLDQRGATLAQRSVTRNIRPPLSSRLGQSIFFRNEAVAGLGVRLDVGPDLLRERGRLVVALFRRPGMQLIAREEVAPLQAPVLTARLLLPELEPGAYSLHVVLKQPGLDGMARVAETRHELRVLPSRLR